MRGADEENIMDPFPKEPAKEDASWSGKSKGNKLGYRIFIKVLRFFGVAPAYFLLRFVAAYYVVFSRSSNRQIRYLFHNRLNISGIEIVKKILANYYWFGQSIIDRIVMMSGIKNQLTFNFDDEVHFNKMIADGKGGLLLSAHLGNWEIAGHLLKKRFSTPINIVMYDGEGQALKQYLTGVTGQRNAHIIIIKDNLSHIYEIMEALNNNEFVCMHADRFLPGNKTLSVNFLGAAAKFPLGPFALASKLDVPVSFVFAIKQSATHYHFSATPGTIYRNLADVSETRVLKEFICVLEEKVKAYPTQWYNYYAFWDEQAAGRPQPAHQK